MNICEYLINNMNVMQMCNLNTRSIDNLIVTFFNKFKDQHVKLI